MSGDVQCVNITIEDDMIVEGDHTIALQLEPGLEFPLGQIDFDPMSSVIVIEDNDVVLLAFNQSEYPTLESSMTVEVCVVMVVAPAGGLECNISVTLGLQNGSKAVLDMDYNATDPLEVTFVAGVDVQGSSRCVDINIIDDQALEGPHNFTVTLDDFDIVGGSPNTAKISLWTPSTATVIIEDNEDATVKLNSTVYDVNEEDGSVSVCVALCDIPTGGLECEIEVSLGTADGAKAVAGMDYDAIPIPDPLVFPTSSTEGMVLCAMIGIIDDTALEGEHSFSVHITSTSPQISIEMTYATVEIQDNERASIGMEQSSYMSEEGDGYLMICVEISDVPTGGLECDIDVYLEATNGTAESPTDYEVPGVFSVTFPQNASNGTLECINITIVDNEILDCLRHFEVGVVHTSLDPLITIGSAANVSIEDNDHAIISLRDNATEVLEGAGNGSVEVCVILEGLPSGGLDCDITVELATTDITAREGLDYEATSHTITIPAGSDNGSLTCTDTTVFVLDDDIVEYTESFGIQIVSSDPVLYIGDPGNATVVIVDDDKVTVGLRILESDYGAVYTVYEGNVTEVCADLIGRLERPVNISIDAYYQPIGQIEKGNGIDFAIPNSVTFGGSASPFNTISVVGEQCFDIVAINDTFKEDDEYFKLLLSSEDDQVCFCQDFALFNILEDESDGVYAAIKNTSLVVSESAGAVYVCVEIIGILETQVIVTIETLEGSAEVNSDFLYVSQDLYFDGCLNITEQCLYIPILNDVCLEEEEYFYINVSSSFDCVSAVNVSEQVTIVDDDCVVIGIEYNDTEYDEDAGVISVCAVIKNGQIKRDVEVYLNVDEGLTSGDVNADPSSVLTFTPNNSLYAQCVNISIVDDAYLEYTEYITVFLNTTDPYVKLAYSEIHITIQDNDNATLELTMDEYIVNEVQGSVNVCVALIGHVDREVVAHAFTVESTAEAGSDFSDTSAYLTFDSEGTICFEIPINATDAALENDETFVVVLTTRDDDIEITRQTAKVIIVDDSNVMIGFELQSYTTPEEDDSGNGAIVEVCVVVYSGGNQLERDVIVSLSTTEVTASAGEDYEDVLLTQTIIELVFSVGESKRKKRFVNDMECVNISIISDTLVEDDEVFMVLLSTNDPDVILSPQAANITIESNDNATVALEQLSYSVDEDDGIATVCCILTEGDLQKDISVQLTTSDITATETQDYNAVSGSVMIFLAGSVVGFIKCDNITIINNSPVEELIETFEVSLSSSDPCVSLVNSTGTVSIMDDDFVTITLDMMEYTVIEDYAYLEVCVNITDGTLERNVEVQLYSMDGTAEAGNDYGQLNETVIFTPGVFQMCVNGSILEDVNVENDETFTIKLTSSDQAVLIGIDNAVVYIWEDVDTVVVGFEEASYFVGESALVLSYNLHIWGWLERDVTVYITTNNGSAILGEDFEEPENSSITFRLGLHGHSYYWLFVAIISDVYYEGDENFYLVLSTADSAVVFNLSKAEVTIDDDDPVELGLQQEEYTICEGDLYVIVCLELFSGQLASTVELSANLSTQDYSAQGGVDYGSVEDYPLVIPGGSGPGNASCVHISITDDSILEYNETFTVSLSFEYLDNVTFDPTEAKVTIKDDDNVTISFDVSAYEFMEELSYREVCVSITAGSSERSLEVQLSSMNVTAAAGDDYVQVNMAVVFAPGVSQVCVNVSILEDEAVEYDESFTLSLTSADPAVVIGSIGSTEVTILEDDDTIQFGFEVANYTVSEGAGSVQYHLVFLGWLEREIIITVSAVEGSAELGQDYEEPENTTIVLPAGIHGPIGFWRSVAIINDSLFENEETFVLTLTADCPSVVVFNEGQAEVAIEDDDNIVYSLQQDEYNVCETSTLGGLIVCADRVSGVLGPGTAVTLHFETCDVFGSEAQAGVDYVSLSLDVVMNAGSQTSGCGMILIIDDSMEESCVDEVFEVKLTAVSPRVTIGSGSSLVNIADDDQSGDFSISVVNDTPMVSGGNVTVDVAVGGACPDTFECTIDGSERDCTASTLFQLPIRPRLYTLVVEASSVCFSTGSVSLPRQFRTDDPRQCSVHLINEVVVDSVNMMATFQWEGTGPNNITQVSNFQCRVDDDPYVSCGEPDQNVNEESVDISSLSPGDHIFSARPGPDAIALGCVRRVNYAIDFTVPEP